MDLKPIPKGVCYAYARNGHCKFKNCKFSHDLRSTQRTSGHNNTNKNNTDDLLTWKRHLQQNARLHKPNNNKYFFQTAHKLISIDPSTQQEVIRSLSTEAGLRQIRSLVEQDYDGNDTTKVVIFTNEIRPFLAVITHADVLASLVLEQAVVTIYNFLYGVTGRRAVPFLEFLVDVVRVLAREGGGAADTDSDSDTGSSPAGACLDAALLVFWHIVEKNSTAFVQESLKQVAVLFQSLCETAVSPSPQTQTLLERLLRRFELVSDVSVRPAQKSSKSSSAAASAAFVVKKDPPGGRHNNDHADICKVQILPTFQEILSSRTEYLPVKDPRQWHEGGIAGLLDRHFRLLREDTVGQLRDAIHAELQPNVVGSRDNKNNNQARTHVYSQATIKRLGFDRFAGLRVLVVFPQPPNLRGKTKAQRREWWEASKRLQTSALVCLVRSPGFTIFCTVAGPDRPRPSRPDMEQQQQQQQHAQLKPSLWEDADVASIVVELAEPTEENRLSVMGCHGAYDRRLYISLVEFPGVLLPSFQPTLLALQKMKTAANLPMPEVLVADAGDTADPVDVPPPAYASSPGFSFNLRCLMNDESTLEVRPSQPVDLERLHKHSSLDEGQAKALVHTLQRRVGLIQGPPGTGKSYTGVALIKVLLANRAKIKRFGPIICVCYTNHALDQLLEDVLESKITRQIIRIGSQSKSEVLQSKNLREVSREVDRTRIEKQEQYKQQTVFDRLEQEFDTLRLESSGLKKYLSTHDRRRFRQLFMEDEDGFQRYSKHGKHKIIDSWLHSGKASKGKPRSLYELENVHVDEMTAKERKVLHDHWIKGNRELLHAKANAILSEQLETKRSYDDIRDEVNLRCLRGAHVIGVTTTGLARNLNMLRRLQSKVILCEEAGEVLEAHMLTSLLPSVEHVILIGDHQQLRPQIQNYALSRESNVGQQYSLDQSLFERLVQPDDDSGGRIPFCTLEMQRRMHPSIAQLVRDTLYPRLQDAPSVAEYPEVVGMRKRLFWLDHRRLEGRASSDEAANTSHWNDYEIDLTLALVSHLLRQGVYRSGDIAVLTPYLGQLHQMRRRLSRCFAIALGERDQEDLDKAGFADEGTVDREEAATSAVVARSTVLQALRVATIDNFQGEEAKVVVISLVRSNNQNRCGFLRTPNRINVLLSRAKHGMYIIGNSETSRGVGMWAQVLDILDKGGNFGPTLDLQCPRHPDSPIAVSEPEHFTQFSPEGGCNLLCGKRLQCGHPCKQKCHSELLHQAVYCLETCPRPLKGCTHACPKPCGDRCPKRCLIEVFDAERVLPCGHLMATLPCWQAQDLNTVRCPMPVKKQVRHCNHEVTVACHIDVTKSEYKCTQQCRSILPCGHNCKRECWQCTVHGAEDVQIDHGACTEKCGRPYTTCTHACDAPCHGTEPCQPCMADCAVQCGHSRCPRKCSEPCAPCAVPTCLSACPHSACTMPCAAPCDHTPCSLRCDKVLSCGHRCPSLCGEVCPSERFCQTCATDEIADTPVDFILGQTYREIELDENPCIFPPCGHFLTVESMDGQMDLKKHYVMDAMEKPVAIASSSEPFSGDDSLRTCASCRGSLRSIARYGRLVRRALLDESTKKFILYLNQAYVPMAEELPRLIADLQNRELGPIARSFRKEMVIKIQGPPDHQVRLMSSHLKKCGSTRWQDMNRLRAEIVAYYEKVDVEEQPFTQVWSRVEDARRRKRTTGQFSLDESVLQTKGSIQALSLLIRLDIALLGDFISLHTRVQPAQSTLEVNLRINRQQCQTLINMATSSRRMLQQIEGNLFQAQLCALERQAGTEPAQAENLLHEGTAALDAAKLLCEQYPHQARGLDGEIEGTQKMLRAGTFYAPVSSEERVAIVKAMAREFLGTGHWYYCANGHPFTIGECGGAVQLSRCPECGSTVGGQGHQTAAGVTRATDLEEGLGRLQLG